MEDLEMKNFKKMALIIGFVLILVIFIGIWNADTFKDVINNIWIGIQQMLGVNSPFKIFS